MSRQTFRLDGADWKTRQIMLARLGSLIIACNIRVMYAEPLDAAWSSYQYSLACTMLGLDPLLEHSDEHMVIATKYGTWEREAGVVIEAMTDILREWLEQSEDEDDAEA